MPESFYRLAPLCTHQGQFGIRFSGGSMLLPLAAAGPVHIRGKTVIF